MIRVRTRPVHARFYRAEVSNHFFLGFLHNSSFPPVTAYANRSDGTGRDCDEVVAGEINPGFSFTIQNAGNRITRSAGSPAVPKNRYGKCRFYRFPSLRILSV
jgi:hypothetical protein